LNNKNLKYYQKLVEGDIGYCENCQRREGDGIIWDYGLRRNLEELFDDHNVPEDMRDEIADLLICPFCGHSDFYRGCYYGAKTASEREADRRWEIWQEKYSEQVNDFAKHLENHPYLGLLHPIGKEIQKTIKHFPKTKIINQNWVRARKSEGSKPLTTQDLMPPGKRYAHSEGRFSHFGQSVFYLSNSPQAALAEILNRKAGEKFGWIQKFKILDAGQIIDLRKISVCAEDFKIPVIALGLIHEQLPMSNPDPELAWKPEYFIPRFISDCTKHEGIDGIIFQSKKHYYANLVLFNWSLDKIEPVGEPTIVQLNEKVLPELE